MSSGHTVSGVAGAASGSWLCTRKCGLKGPYLLLLSTGLLPLTVPKVAVLAEEASLSQPQVLPGPLGAKNGYSHSGKSQLQ